jgi:hypothetical protein
MSSTTRSGRSGETVEADVIRSKAQTPGQQRDYRADRVGQDRVPNRGDGVFYLADLIISSYAFPTFLNGLVVTKIRVGLD